MPVHDWTRVEAGIFHAFHHGWIEELHRALNKGILPPDYYALPEQYAAGFGPDVLTLQGVDDGGLSRTSVSDRGTNTLIADRKLEVTAESDLEFYRRKQASVVVRHASGDRVVAIIEVVSPGNKASRHAFRSLIEKSATLLEQRIHLLLIDLLPPGRRDPKGLHAALWEEIAGQDYSPPVGKPLTLASYESGLTVNTYVRGVGVGDELPEMPLFLEPEVFVMVPLEATGRAAFEAMPQRWRRVLESA